ncbi:porin [uncultured Oxalicibacterium sp.]|uniref:porin n=1 Tax=uncultured Oxalicibacterium sp. TaxID=1168540 RepID=UPI0025ECE313|nr:porin [uncultured Oxalicibacterium sp.]
MKKILACLALLSLWSFQIHAQPVTMTIYGTFDNEAPKGQAPKVIESTNDSISIYGTIDAGVRHVTNTNARGGDLWTVGSNGHYYNNRIGVKGTEDLGGGLNAHFHFETGFNSGTGALDNNQNRLFNRISSVGVAGDFGSLDLGRQPSVACKVVHAYDPFSYRFVQLIPLAGAVAGNADPDNPFGKLGGTRFSNAAQYIGKFGGFTGMAEYSFGEEAGSNSDGSAKAIGFVYRFAEHAIGAAYTRQRPNVAAANAAPVFADQDQLTIGGSWKSGPLRIAGGYIGASSDTTRPATLRTARNIWLGGSYDVNPLVSLTTGYYRSNIESTSGAKAQRDLTLIGATYALSKRTNLYANIDRVKLGGFISVVAGRETMQTGISVGINHMF